MSPRNPAWFVDAGVIGIDHLRPPSLPHRKHMPEASVMAKARCAEEVRGFIDIPNVGPATAGDFARLGLRAPAELVGCDAFALYRRLCDTDGVRHDPCVIDVFLAAVDFMRGAPARPWWHYTPERKALLDHG